MTDRVVTAHDGIELAVRDHGGSGPDVVFIHGALRSLEDWAPVIGELSGVHAVAMELRMHGQSDTPPTPRWDDFVRDVDAVVRTMELERPLVVGHSFGGVVALADAAAHADRSGVVDIDGFDFRERALYDDVDPTDVDRFVEDFRHFAPPDHGDDEWLEEQREMMRQLSSAWKVPDDVAEATFERIFVRDGEGWSRRPSNGFFDFVNTDEGRADTLQLLREAKVPAVFVLCHSPGDAGMFAKGRAGLERHIRTIASEDGKIRLETIDASHGVIFEEPARIAEIVRSML